MIKNALTVVAGAALGWTPFEQGLSFLNTRKTLREAETRDSSRSGNKSFGLNYGFTTDRAIEEMLDTGDLLFVQCNCWALLAEQQIRLCFLRQTARKLKDLVKRGYASKDYWDAVGLIYRDPDGPVVLSDLQGIRNVYSYYNFLALPGVQAVQLRKLSTKDPKLGFVDVDFQAKAMKRQSPAWLESSDGVDIVRQYLQTTGLDNGELYSTVEEVETKALVKPELGKYGPAIVVRTEQS